MMKERTSPLQFRPALLLAAGCLLLITISGFISWEHWQQNTTLSDADQRAIKHVTLIAFGSADELVVVPHASPDLSVKIADADIATARQHAREVFQSIYDASCTGCQVFASRIDSAIDGQSKGLYRALDGGVRDAHWPQIVASWNGEVTVTLEATAWSKLVAHGYIDTPTEDIVMVYTLHKVNANWLIIDQVRQNAPSGFHSSHEGAHQELETRVCHC